MNLEDTDPTFEQDLQDSNDHVWRVAQWLQGRGMPSAVNPVWVRPSVDQRVEFADGGDITMLQRVEVKHRFIDFTSAEDFPYKTIIVDVSHTWDNARPKAYMYVLTNKEITHCCIVKSSTRKYWEKLRKFDSRVNREREFYECPIEYCRFMAM